jgi:SNF2 family DNA or RNA helicase
VKFLAELDPAGYQLVPLTKLLASRRNGLLICDGVGVGKTISAGYILVFLSTAFRTPGLVICPAGLQDKWHLELKTRFGLDVVAIRSREEADLNVDYWNHPSQRSRIFVLPSSLLQAVETYQFRGPIVVDEIHNYRNPLTRSWKAIKAISARSSHRIGLSATPINNRANDLAAELSILMDIDINAAEAVVADVWRPDNIEALYSVITRFTKEKLGVHFAKREVHDIVVPMSDGYAERVLATVKSLRSRPKSEALYRDEITYFRLAASSSRAFIASTGASFLPAFSKAEILNQLLSEYIDEPVIVVVSFEETAKELVELVTNRRMYLLTGSVPIFEREGILADFRGTSNGVLIMTSVGTEGLDLQSCATLINFDLTWNPMVLEQRIGRIDRIGQKKPVVRIINMIVNGSIDERMIRTLGRKLELIQGSVFEPSTIISSYGNKMPLMFTDGELLTERRRAELLVETAAFSERIIPRDYEILANIDTNFCSSRGMQEAASLSGQATWLKPGNSVAEWWRELSRNGDRLERVIAQYENAS